VTAGVAETIRRYVGVRPFQSNLGSPMRNDTEGTSRRADRASLLACSVGLTVLTATKAAVFHEVPWNNEGVYLLAPWKWWRPTFLANDWALALPCG